MENTTYIQQLESTNKELEEKLIKTANDLSVLKKFIATLITYKNLSDVTIVDDDSNNTNSSSFTLRFYNGSKYINMLIDNTFKQDFIMLITFVNDIKKFIEDKR